MKAIRKCDEKVTAQQLGVEVGDKFVVLSKEDSYEELQHRDCFVVGDVLVLKEDDGTSIPYFEQERTGDGHYESFSCLARYEEQQKNEEPALSNVKFDMKAIAEELGVSLEKAHNIVQTALFEKGVERATGGTGVRGEFAEFLFVDDNYKLWWGDEDVKPSYKLTSIKSQYSFSVKEEVETIEFNGKQYNKEEFAKAIAKALALLSPIE